MNLLSPKYQTISLSLMTILLISFVESRKEKIKLKDIEVLTLKPNQWTTGRRTRAVPQLQCVGGYCDAIKGQTVQCYNRGSDGVDVQWECKTQISSDHKFGSIDVICEGYDYADDDYVLIGSCGLEYSIASDPNHKTSNQGFGSSPYISKPSNGVSFGFIICIVFIIFIIYYTCLRSNGVTPDGRQTRAPGGPPPPGFRSDFFDGSDGCSGSSSAGFTGFGTTRTDRTYRNANNGNGFFSGLLTGGTLGYLFGSRNTTNYRDQSSYFQRQASPPSFFGSNSGSFGSSTTTTTTSGFGGTKRR